MPKATLPRLPAMLLVATLAACQVQTSSPVPDTASGPAANAEQAQPRVAQTAVAEPPIVQQQEPLPGPEPISLAGFGPAAFGSNQEAVRIAWGRPLLATQPAPGASCHYLVMDPRPEHGRGLAFMIEDGKFVRYDVDLAEPLAPGGIGVGDPMEKVLQSFVGRTQVGPDKYIPGGHTIAVSDPGHPQARLVFQADASGRIIAWRVGVQPQVDYVEGCG